MPKLLSKAIASQVNSLYRTISTDSAVEASCSLAKQRKLLFDIKSVLVCCFLDFDNKRDDVLLGNIVALRSLGFISINAVDLFYRYRDSFLQTIRKTKEMASASNLRAADYYQILLTLELSISEDLFEIQPSKIQRDASGSYYTPEAFSTAITRRAFECFGNSLPAEMRIVDFSCGAGDFLIAAFRELKKRGMKTEQAIQSLWAFDVDPIALIVSLSELLHVAGLSTADAERLEIGSRFVLGNPLMICPKEDSSDSETKIELYAKGLIYSREMAVSETVFPESGFHMVLGNPPWEKVRIEERKFFKLIMPDVASIPNKAKRHERMNTLRTSDPAGVFGLFDSYVESFERLKSRLNLGGRAIPAGELNTYSLFTQLALGRGSAGSVVALIIKSAIATSTVNAELFSSIVSKGEIEKVFFYSNKKGIFPIDSRERFCVVFFRPNGNLPLLHASFGNVEVDDLLKTSEVSFAADDLTAVNRNTGLIPDVDSNTSFHALLKVQRKFEAFGDIYKDCHFGRLVHLTMHAPFISTESNDSNIGILEGKFISQHDLRFATFEGVSEEGKYAPKASARKMNEAEKAIAKPQPRFYIDKTKWREISRNYKEGLMLCWRSLTSSTNERTTLAAISPFVPSCQSIQFLQTPDATDLVILAGLFNSKPFDYLVRLKLPGIDLTQAIILQIPVPSNEMYEATYCLDGVTRSIKEHIVNQVVSLYAFEEDVLKTLSSAGLQFECLDIPKQQLISNLDDLFFRLYECDENERDTIERSFV